MVLKIIIYSKNNAKVNNDDNGNNNDLEEAW